MRNYSGISFSHVYAKELLSNLSLILFDDVGIPMHFVTSDDVSVQLSNRYGVDFPSFVCGEGNTISYLDNVQVVFIGSEELYNADDNDIVDADVFVKTVVAMYHEKMHVDQIDYVLSLDTPTAKYVSLSCFSSYIYPDYHNVTYFIQADEIQAEYYGVLNGYKFLLDLTHDKELSNDLICRYVNDRYGNNVSFLNKNDYTDVKDVFDDFHTVFRENCGKHKDFEIGDISKMSISDQRALEAMEKESNGNVQNGIATKRFQVHLYAKGDDTNDWSDYARFMQLPVVRALDLTSKKVATKLRSMFFGHAHGREIKPPTVDIDVMELEQSVVDYAKDVSDDEYE